MIVWRPLLGHFAQGKSIQHLVIQQQLSLSQPAHEDCISSSLDPPRQFFSMPTKHELEQLSYRLGILLDLLLRRRVEDCKACVYVPLVRVYAQRNVDLDILDAADVAVDLPRELVVGTPCGAHAQEGGVRDSLRVGGDAVMHRRCEVDVFGAEAREDLLYQLEALLGCTMIDEDQGLTFGVDVGTVQGVAGNNLHV